MHLSIREKSLAHIREALGGLAQVPSNTKKEKEEPTVTNFETLTAEIEKLGTCDGNHWERLRAILHAIISQIILPSQEPKKKGTK